MPARDDGPPPGLNHAELTGWAIRQIASATCAGEIRAALRVLMASGRDGPQR